MESIKIKTKEEIKTIIEGGKRLSEIKHKLEEGVKEGVSAWEIEETATDLIKKTGGEASFKRVQGYKWATCVNINEGIVHGIPKREIVFKKGDLVSVDVGLYFRGLNTDTSFTKGLNIDRDTQKFLETGKKTLQNAINKALPGGHIYDISESIEKTLGRDGYKPVMALVGHGVGKDLHEGPQIPQFTYGERSKTPLIVPGMVLAIEVIYTTGSGMMTHEKDGWTIVTSDGKISALYEDSVVVREKGNLVVTR